MKLEFIDIGKINVDGRYQRHVDERRVKKNAGAFAEGAVKAVSLSQRADGSLWCYDGQHTLETFRTLGVKNIPATIVHGCPESEARWFLLMNGDGVRKANMRDRHKAGVVSNDERACEVEEIINRYGLKLAKGGSKAGEINSIGTIRALARNNKQALIAAMDAIDALWKHEDRAWTGVVLRGMFDVSMSGELPIVADGLKKHKVTPQRILDVAGGLQMATGVPGGGSAYAKRAIISLARID